MTGELLVSELLKDMTPENSGLVQEQIDHLRKVMRIRPDEIAHMGKWTLGVLIGRTMIETRTVREWAERMGIPLSEFSASELEETRSSRAGAKPEMAQAVLDFLRERNIVTAGSED